MVYDDLWELIYDDVWSCMVKYWRTCVCYDYDVLLLTIIDYDDLWWYMMTYDAVWWRMMIYDYSWYDKRLKSWTSNARLTKEKHAEGWESMCLINRKCWYPLGVWFTSNGGFNPATMGKMC